MTKQRDFESLETIVKAINKQYGEGTLVRGNVIRQDIPRITSGILAYDMMLGGGWPVNQWSEIIGNESSGKTAIAYKTIAANQAANPEFTALWVAAEEYVPSYAAAIGVDLERLMVAETNVMEEVYDLVIRVMDNRAADMIVIDSLPALVPGEEAEKSMDAFTVGLGARLTGKFLRKSGKAQRRSLLEADDDRPVTCLFINQWRDQIGVMFGDPRTTPGGKAKNYHYFVRVEVKRDEWLKDKDEVVGQTIKARTVKNKTYASQKTAVVDFYFADTAGFHFGDFDTLKDMINIAITKELISRGGAYYSYAGERWQGKEALLAGFREDLDLQDKLRDEIIREFM